MNAFPPPVQASQQALDAMEKAIRNALTVVPADLVRQRLEALRPDIDAAEQQLRQAQLGELLHELDAEFGPVPAELLEQAAREWPDYEEE